MNNPQYIRGPGGEVLGRIDEAGDQSYGYDKLGNLVFRYSSFGDMTYDKNGMAVGRGNMLAALIFQPQ